MEKRIFDGVLWLAISIVIAEILAAANLSSSWGLLPLVFFVTYLYIRYIVKKLWRKFIHSLAIEVTKVKTEL